MARLVLVDTSDQLPGLLPLHAWSALMSSELVLVASPTHPFAGQLDIAELRVEAVPTDLEQAAPTDLLGHTPAPGQRAAEWVVERARAVGEAVYLFGPDDGEGFTRTLGMEAARSGVEVEIVYFGVAPKGIRLLELVGVEERLRGPDGCPWDREQTHRSLIRHAVEEVYELAEAVEAGEPGAIQEELGDLLLQVVFQSQIGADEGAFDIDDVAGGIVDKLVRRHPHVFGDAEIADADGVMARWEELKAQEKPYRSGVFDGVVEAQPALGYAEKLQGRAAKAGVGRGLDDDVVERVRADLDEVVSAADPEARDAALGELLMSVIGLARRQRVDPETALRGAARRFRQRVDAAEQPGG